MYDYADIVIDISHESLDKTFQYIIPDNMKEVIKIGMLVKIPFGSGNKSITGYVVELTNKAAIAVSKMKEIAGIETESIPIESQLIELALWMKNNYASTMIQSLKTVIPVKQKIAGKQKRRIYLNISKAKAEEQLTVFVKKHNTARARLLEQIIQVNEADYSQFTKKYNISSKTIKELSELGIIRVEAEIIYRNPVNGNNKIYNIILSDEQRNVADSICADNSNSKDAYLIHGITGSGKTEVYMEIIAKALSEGKQTIMLIPEIALTYQTVSRFYMRFGQRVSIMNSRMSKGERYDQYQRAKNGEIDVMIGPRSALFTPFAHLGYIIIDEEHESAYKSETIPRYHARETAVHRAKMCGAKVVLGSATPSLESYSRALKGEYGLFTLSNRMNEGKLAKVDIVDLREEMRSGNRSILSEKLKLLIKDRLEKKEQVMLFINRRGYESFVSCRSCGHVLKCPHCDVALTEHNNGKLICHYCGYEKTFEKKCPECGSKYIGGFKAGTQKIEQIVKKEFPTAKILRMDMDTTRKKDSHEKILSQFASGNADILIGTQMIVKGHDFGKVTLVGVLAADLSLYTADYRAAEKTFQLLTQAAGRAGRGKKEGHVIIQTYAPDNYSIIAASNQDYLSFYNQEIEYRELMDYPPASHMLMIMVSSKDEMFAMLTADLIKQQILSYNINELVLVGPASAPVSKIKDIYKKVIYLKNHDSNCLIRIKDDLEKYFKINKISRDVNILYDFEPMNIF